MLLHHSFVLWMGLKIEAEEAELTRIVTVVSIMLKLLYILQELRSCNYPLYRTANDRTDQNSFIESSLISYIRIR